MSLGTKNVETVQRHDTRNLAECSGHVGAHDDDRVLGCARCEATIGHHFEHICIGEQLPGHVAHVATTEDVLHAIGEFGNEPRLPIAPCGHARRLRIAFGEGTQ